MTSVSANVTQVVRNSEINDEKLRNKMRSPILTAREEEMLRNIADGGIKFCAIKMDLETSYIYQRCYRLRKKIQRAQTFLNKIIRYRKESPRLRKLLTVVDDDFGNYHGTSASGAKFIDA